MKHNVFIIMNCLIHLSFAALEIHDEHDVIVAYVDSDMDDEPISCETLVVPHFISIIKQHAILWGIDSRLDFKFTLHGYDIINELLPKHSGEHTTIDQLNLNPSGGEHGERQIIKVHTIGFVPTHSDLHYNDNIRIEPRHIIGQIQRKHIDHCKSIEIQFDLRRNGNFEQNAKEWLGPTVIPEKNTTYNILNIGDMFTVSYRNGFIWPIGHLYNALNANQTLPAITFEFGKIYWIYIRETRCDVLVRINQKIDGELGFFGKEWYLRKSCQDGIGYGWNYSEDENHEIDIKAAYSDNYIKVFPGVIIGLCIKVYNETINTAQMHSITPDFNQEPVQKYENGNISDGEAITRSDGDGHQSYSEMSGLRRMRFLASTLNKK